MRAKGKWIGLTGATALCAAACLCAAVASNPPGDFERANRLYEQGHYPEAISIYETMIQSGRISSAVFFNLGNAYFKGKQLGRALCNYRRAELLDPRDPDIQANLRFAREQVSGSLSVQRPLWVRVARYFTLNELAAAVSALFWIWMSLLSIALLRPPWKPALRPFSIAAGLLWAASASHLIAAREIRSTRTAVVVAPNATVHLGPLSESQPAFTAADGTELKVHARRDSWFQVSDRSNRTGWIEAANVEIVLN